MQRPRSKTVTLDDILITEELSRRSPRPPNWQAEAQAMQSLAQQMVQPEIMLQTLVDIAIDLCKAGTVGVSLLETAPDGEEIFRPNVLAGKLAQYVGGTTPRNFSPCGVCLDRGTPQLFSYPERYFTYFQAANTPIGEGLVLPLIADNHVLGTIWIMSHDEQRHFDSEDVRVMTSLADFTATALLLKQRQTQELLAANVRLEAEIAQRKRTEETAREAEAYFRAIANLVPDLLWRNDTTGDTSWYNDRWLDYTGQTLLEAQGYGWLEVIHPSDRAKSLTNFQNTVDQRCPLRQEHRIRGRDGSYRWFQVQVEPAFDADGRIVQWFGAAIDIHEQRMALAALRESEHRLRAMIENLPGGAAFVVDHNLRYLLAAGEALSIAGFKSEDLVGKTVFEAMPPELVANYEAVYRKGLAGEAFEFEHNAHDRTYISRGTPLRSVTGEVYAVLAVSYDITKRKQAEAALRESEERFRLLVTASSDIVYRMSADWQEMRNLEGKRFLVNTDNPSHTWIETYIPPEEQPRVWAAIQDAICTKSIFELEHRVIQQDGVIGWTFSRAIPMLNQQGDIVEWFGTASDVTERKQAEVALRESEARLAVELADAKQLQFISSQLVQEENIDALYGQILAAAIALMRSEMGSMQVLHPDRNELQLLTWKGFDPASAAFWQWVRVDSDSTCGVALKTGERAIVPDVEKSEFMAGSRDLDAYRRSGVRAVQTTPLISRSGRVVGMISTHWQEPHQPSERELGLLDVLARQAADLIEQRQAEAALRENEQRMHGQKEAFQAAVNGAPLADSLAILTRLVSQETAGEARTAFYIANAEGSSLHPIYGAGSMPDAYLDQVDGFAIGEDSLACGLAIPIGCPVLTRDVHEEPLWQPWVQMAEAYDYRGCWSFPIVTRDDRKGVGTFAMYFRQPRQALPRDLALAEIVTQSAAVIINSHFEAQERDRAEAALRESEAKYRSLFNAMDEGYMLSEVIFDENDKPIDILYLEANPAAIRLAGRDFSGQRMREIDPNYEEYWYEIYGRIALTGVAVRAERYAEPHGRWFDFYAFKVGESESRHVATVFQDISDRKRTEVALRKSEERLRDVLNSMTEGFALLGGDFTILDVNEETLRLDGRSRDELIGRSHWDAFPGTEDSPVGEIFRRVARERIPASLEHMYCWSDERSLWIDMRVYPTRHNGVAIFWRDVTDRKQAEAALRESEAKYRSLFNSMDEAYAVVEVMTGENGEWNDFLFLEVNPAFVKQTSMEYPVGRKATELLGTPNPRWAKIYGRVAETGESIRFEEGEATLGRVFDLYVFRLGGEGSCRVAVLFTDITDRKLTEEQLRRAAEMDAFRVKLSDTLRSLSDSEEIKYQAACVLGKHLGSDRAYYVEIDEACSEFVVARDWHQPGSPSHAHRYPLSGWLMPWLVDGQPWVVRDVDTDPAMPDDQRASYRGNNIGALIVVPLIKSDRLVATLATNQHTPREWTADEIIAVQETAERTWAAVERAYAEAALQKSEEKYRSLFESIDEGFTLLEMISDESGHPSDFRIVETNPVWEQQTGLTDAIGKTLLEVTPNFEQQWLDFYGDVVISGRGRRTEYYTASVDRWYTVYASRIGGEGSRQVAVVFNDISDRKRREAHQAFLNEVSQDLAHLTNIDETMNAIGAKIGAHFYASQCPFGEIDEEQQFVTVTHEWKRPDSPSYMGTHLLSDFNTEEFRQTMSAGETYVMRDAANDPRAHAAQMAALSIGAFVSVPLVREGKWRFNLTLFDTKARDWRENEVELLNELTIRIWTRLERARAEESLLVSEQKYRSLFESINDGFALLEVLYDADNQPVDCRFLEVSPSFESQTGLPQAQGKTLRELIPSIEPGWFEHYHQALVTNALVHFEMWEDYLKTWLEVDVIPYGNPQERQVTIVFRNINERKQAEAERLQLIREQVAREQERQRAESLAELDRAKTLFFSNISHEFRTPLTLSLAPLQDVLSDRTLPSAHRERLELAHRNSLRLLKLVNTLLDFSRIEAGRMEAVYESTDLAQFTTELASVFRSAIEQARLRLIVNCLPLPEAVYVDREMWEKIVLNLISNAFKFTLEGEISVKLQPVDHHVILEVEDTGTGIAPEELPHLFERFYQVRGVQARSHEGSGIGLALVHELVQLQGGTINVSSMPGQGSCFTIALPFGSEHLPQERIKVSRTLESTAIGAAPYVQEAELWLPQESAELEENSLTQNSQTACILIVDDNADMRDYLTRILSDRFQVEAVADGAAALLAAQTQVPDLILSDVMMPGLDGFQLLQALRADPRTREVPVILLSARAGEEAIVEALEAGADDYLIKPFSAAELVSRVNAHLQSAQLHSEALAQERTLNRRKDELLSIVSHELNTPLVAILGWTRLLRATPPSQSMLSKSLDTIERNATLQAKLIQDLLDISRIEAGKLRLRLEPVQLKSVIESAIAAVMTAAIAKDIHLESQHSLVVGASEITIMGDHDRLQQIITNLLTNAIKFTPNQGSINIELSVIEVQNSSNASYYAEISITDTGIGICAEFLPHVFDHFCQADNSGSSKGLGLGLAIARHLVQLHNGTLDAESSGIGQGATFTVKLPILQEF